MNQRKIGIVLQYVQVLASILVTIIYTPILIRVLGQSEYGIYSLVGSIIAYINLISLGFESSYIRFYSRYREKNDEEGLAKLNGLFFIVFAIIAGVSLLCGVVISFNIESFFSSSLTVAEITLARKLMIILSFNLALTFIGVVLNAYITAQEKFVFQKTLNIIRTIFNPIVTIPFLLLGYGSISVTVIATLITIIIDMINFIFCKNKLKVKFAVKGMPKDLFKEIFFFSIFIALNSIVEQINWNVDKIIIGKIIGSVGVAIYAAAAMLNSLYANLSFSICNIFAPKINMIEAKNEDDKNEQLNNVFIKVGKMQYIILMLILTGFIFFGKYFMDLWAGEGYGESYYIAICLLVPATITSIQNMGLEIQRAKNKHKFASFVNLGASISNIILSIILCKMYGVIACALGTTVSVFISTIIINIYYYKKLEINTVKFWKEILRLSMGLIIPCLVGIVIFQLVEYTNIFVYIACVGLYSMAYIISMCVLGLKRSEKEIIKKLVKKGN